MDGLVLRPVDPAADRDLLVRLYGETRDDVAKIVGWTDEQRRTFVVSQFDAQDAYYRAQFPDARFDVIEIEGEPVGRLYVDRRADEIRILDLALFTSQRGRGVGTVLMRGLIDEGRARRVPVTIHVEQTNPARALYERLGFRVTGEVGIHWFMEWTPGAAPAPDDPVT